MLKHKDVDFVCNRSKQKELRRILRKQSTPAEVALWMLLKKEKIGDLKWRRQFGVGTFILDFYCPKLKLAIELDGEPHYTAIGVEADQRRTFILNKIKDIEIIRFENSDVFNYTENVLNCIHEAIEKRKIELGVNIMNSSPASGPPPL